ncbi:MAG: hypothetical protein R3A52_08010 [Polyangiales bacterium]
MGPPRVGGPRFIPGGEGGGAGGIAATAAVAAAARCERAGPMVVGSESATASSHDAVTTVRSPGSTAKPSASSKAASAEPVALAGAGSLPMKGPSCRSTIWAPKGRSRGSRERSVPMRRERPEGTAPSRGSGSASTWRCTTRAGSIPRKGGTPARAS